MSCTVDSMCVAVMSVLMALSVYQVIISEHLPTSSRNVPVIGASIQRRF